jgi:hypothetical protein
MRFLHSGVGLAACLLLAVQSQHSGHVRAEHLGSRSQFGSFLQAKGLLTGAEVGVQRGLFAAETLAQWPSCDHYILVDLWEHQANYHDGANVDSDTQQQIYEAAQATLAPWAHVTKFMRMLSTQAADLIADNSLDYIYLDARHDFCGVAEDLVHYWPKLKEGGVFAGHDYLTAAEQTAMIASDHWETCLSGEIVPESVKGAVNSFAHAHHLVVKHTDDQWPSWYLFKPKF